MLGANREQSNKNSLSLFKLALKRCPFIAPKPLKASGRVVNTH